MDKYARLQLIYARLQAAPAASTHDEGYALLCETVTAIEDEHSGVPNNPDNWQADGRLYPPQADRAYEVDGFPEVIRYRSFGHNTYIASNGAIEVKIVATNEVDFTKPGADGKGGMGMTKTATKNATKVTEMNEIRQVQRFLTKVFSTARITVDEPRAKGGVWSLDLFLPDYHLAVAWQEGKGFGIVSDDTHGYGEGADEVYESLENALARIIVLVANRRPTTPPEAVRLKDLREQRGLSQEELAKRLGRKQASISRMEARSDFLVSTLQEMAHGLGGRLEVKVVFSDSEKELKFGDED